MTDDDAKQWAEELLQTLCVPSTALTVFTLQFALLAAYGNGSGDHHKIDPECAWCNGG